MYCITCDRNKLRECSLIQCQYAFCSSRKLPLMKTHIAVTVLALSTFMFLGFKKKKFYEKHHYSEIITDIAQGYHIYIQTYFIFTFDVLNLRNLSILFIFSD